MRAKKRISRIAYHTVVLAVGFVMIYPLLWMVMSSFKESSTIFHTAGQLLPTQPTLENYANGWKGFSHTTFATFFKNTFFVAAMGTVGSIVSSGGLRAFAPALSAAGPAVCAGASHHDAAGADPDDPAIPVVQSIGMDQYIQPAHC